MNKICELIKADAFRVNLLTAVAALKLPDCYIAAGFVRNLVWDHLHGFPATPLNDVDVIYFSKTELNEREILDKLFAAHPSVKWQLKNQALMHDKNLDPPYKNSTDAMSYWPELETAIGAKLTACGEIILASPFAAHSILKGFITHNAKRDRAIFLNRVAEKKWLATWPKLNIKL
jgi:uncharacterized protein